MDIAAEIGRTKRRNGLSIRDEMREGRVVDEAVRRAERLGVKGDVAREVVRVLIEGAVAAQGPEPDMYLEGKSATVLGGGGRMGAWFSMFMANRGSEVTVCDPRKALPGYPHIRELDERAADADYIVIASPLGVAGKDLRDVLSLNPRGTVFDLCSVKSHISETLVEGAGRGLRVSSVHPMFGPSAVTPRGRNVLVCSCGSPEADADCVGLFERAGAKVSRLRLDVHDSLISYVLGASHASALAFGKVLKDSGHPLSELRAVGGTSFDKQARLARDISTESKRVYHDIQRLNPDAEDMLDSLLRAMAEVREACLMEDSSRFAGIMEEEKEYFGGWTE